MYPDKKETLKIKSRLISKVKKFIKLILLMGGLLFKSYTLRSYYQIFGVLFSSYIIPIKFEIRPLRDSNINKLLIIIYGR